MTWTRIKVGDLLARKTGTVTPAKSPSERFLLYSIPAFDKGVPEELLGSEIGSSKQILQPGDVLLSKIVPHIRRCWIVGKTPSAHRLIGSGEWIVFRTQRVDAGYLSKILVGDEFHKAFLQTVAGVGGSLKRARPAAVAEIEIPLPPLDEQRRIAAVLDKADALRHQRQESLQLTEKLLQSVFLDMFGDPATNPREWETVPLEKLCERIVDCPHSTPVYSEQPTGFFCVRSSDVQNGKLDLTSTRHVSASVYRDRIARHEPKQGEVIYTREGGRLGYAAQVPCKTKVCLGQRMMLFSAKANVATNAFLASLLNADSFRRRILNLVGGGAAPRVNIKDLRAISVYAPPFKLQERYESFAAKLSDEEVAIQQSERFINSLFSSLQQKAFRGELDLSRLELAPEAETPAVTPVRPPTLVEGRYTRPGSFIAPADIEQQLLAMEEKLDGDQAEPLRWSEDFFKYRTLSQILEPPFSFAKIWSAVEQDFEQPSYETVKNKVFDYVANDVLEQEFDEEQKEIVFRPKS